MNESDIRERLQSLEPDVPWAHHFELAPGVETVTPENEKFYRKSVSLKRLGEIAVDLVPHYTVHGRTEGLRVLDVGCGEGGHSIGFAKSGAQVVGVEGRKLYMARASFAGEASGVADRVRFINDDVRNLSSAGLDGFDVVLAFGILHHLNPEAFYGFLEALHSLTRDTLFVYTHVSSPLSVERHRLKGPVEANGKYEGYLFQEHAEGATTSERIGQVRASLDNTYSFWATQASLTAALSDIGFRSIVNLMSPHLFKNAENASYRPILICRK